MKMLIPNEINRPPGTLQTPPFGDPKSMVVKNMISDELWGAKGSAKGPQMDHFGCQKASKTHQEISRKSVSNKTSVLMPRSYQNVANIGAIYNNK